MKRATGFQAFRLALLVTALGTGACSDSTEPSPPPPAAPLLVDAEQLYLVISDATVRIVPSFPEGVARAQLAQALDGLLTAVQARVVKSVQTSVRDSRDAVASFSAFEADETMKTELVAISMYLDYAVEVIERTLAGS